ncbi:unnamed protein product [Sphenostylis stenocarpa]|uniref:Uncharacterized protein n=1 Tax=Sphenostylis stenocarpa TaxID=92480 RepID=A0AA87B831_9FABA|nr:unnamed protein product [Sphenostylis stenocarpa]
MEKKRKQRNEERGFWVGWEVTEFWNIPSIGKERKRGRGGCEKVGRWTGTYTEKVGGTYCEGEDLPM